jgi:hypothetical protein
MSDNIQNSSSSEPANLGLTLRDAAPPVASPSATPAAGDTSPPAPAPGGEKGAPPVAAVAPDPASSAAARPDYIPEKYWDAEKGEPKNGELSELWKKLEEREAAEAERAKGIPEKPEDYKVALPEGFKIPDGIDLKLDVNDPAFKRAQAFAKERGLTQSDFSNLLAIEAERKAVEHQALLKAVEAEKAKLGENRIARLDAVETKLAAKLPAPQAKALASLMVTADAVEAIETLITMTGLAGFDGSRDGSGRAPVDEDEYSRMSGPRRIALARSLSAAG